MERITLLNNNEITDIKLSDLRNFYLYYRNEQFLEPDDPLLKELEYNLGVEEFFYFSEEELLSNNLYYIEEIEQQYDIDAEFKFLECWRLKVKPYLDIANRILDLYYRYQYEKAESRDKDNSINDAVKFIFQTGLFIDDYTCKQASGKEVFLYLNSQSDYLEDVTTYLSDVNLSPSIILSLFPPATSLFIAAKNHLEWLEKKDYSQLGKLGLYFNDRDINTYTKINRSFHFKSDEILFLCDPNNLEERDVYEINSLISWLDKALTVCNEEEVKSLLINFLDISESAWFLLIDYYENNSLSPTEKIVEECLDELNNCYTVREIKLVWRKLARKYHPDRKGNEEVMKMVNNRKDELISLYS